jgi:hypothetical protein
MEVPSSKPVLASTNGPEVKMNSMNDISFEKKVEMIFGEELEKLGFQKYDQYRGLVAYSCEYLKIHFSHNARLSENDVFLIPVPEQYFSLFTLNDYAEYLIEKGMVSNSMNESSSIDEYLRNAFKLLATKEFDILQQESTQMPDVIDFVLEKRREYNERVSKW